MGISKKPDGFFSKSKNEKEVVTPYYSGSSTVAWLY